MWSSLQLRPSCDLSFVELPANPWVMAKNDPSKTNNDFVLLSYFLFPHVPLLSFQFRIAFQNQFFQIVRAPFVEIIVIMHITGQYSRWIASFWEGFGENVAAKHLNNRYFWCQLHISYVSWSLSHLQYYSPAVWY